MFKFFPDDDEENQKDSTVDKDKSLDADKESQVSFLHSKEVAICESHYSLVSQLRKEDSLKNGHTSDVKVSRRVRLNCVNLTKLLDKVAVNEKVQNILKSTSDLVSGIYEGGFKTWECTFDLVEYLEENFNSIFSTSGHDDKRPALRILDLGCGSGLAGLSVLKLAEEAGFDVRVDFQDYNEEVLDHITIPNTLLNFEDEVAAKCRYFSGDWDSFRDLISPSRYDVILSSETIYNLDYFPKILRVIKSSLDETNCGSSLYLAAKTFYFGVGGGTKAFLRMVGEDSDLEGSVLHLIREGVQREVLCVRRQAVMRGGGDGATSNCDS